MADNQVGTANLARQTMEKWWRMLRALHGGTEAMRLEREEYLPRDWRERRDVAIYEERLRRTFLFSGYANTIAKVVSRPFQRAISVDEIAPPLDLIENNADRSGTSLTDFAYRLYWDMWDRGFCCFLVDHVPGLARDESGEERVLTLAEEQDLDVRPYFCRIDPDNLVGWRFEVHDGQEVLTELRIREYEIETNDDFSETEVERIRVWKPTTWELWERPVKTNSLEPTERLRVDQGKAMGFTRKIAPTPHRFPGDRIPVVTAYAVDRLGVLFTQPPLLNLAYLNLEHWQSSSQQSWILHYARAPILAGRGMTREEAEAGITLGAGAAMWSSSDTFGLEYVEPAGTSMAAGRQHLVDIESRMQSMGMSPLVASAGPDTATGEMRDEVREQSQAQRAVEALEWALFQGYKLAGEWRGMEIPDDFNLAIWRDFNITARSGQDLATLTAMRGRGDLSLETFLTEVKKRAVLSNDLDVDEEIERIQTEKTENAATFGLPSFGSPGGGDDDEEEEDEGPPDEEADEEEEAPEVARDSALR